MSHHVNRSTPRPPRPLSGVRAAFAAAGAALAALTLGAPAASAVPPSEVTVVDQAQVFDDAALSTAVGEVDFREPTDVVVISLDAQPTDEDEEATALNAAVLEHARAEAPQWLSGEKWADGLFILAVDPEARLVGTYFGEDRAVSDGAQGEIQDATKDDFRAGEWNAGAIAGVEEAAAAIGRPWFQHPGFIVLVGALGLGAAGTGIAVIATRASRQRRFADALRRGDEHVARVDADLRTTAGYAAEIPTGSSYGAQVLQQYQTFQQDVVAVKAEGQQLAARTPAERAQKDAVGEAHDWADRAGHLDLFDDVVADTAVLLTMSPGWQAAWKRQVDPFRQDLDEVPGVVDLAPEAAESDAARELLDFAGTARAEIQVISNRLNARQMTSDLALDGLHRLRVQLSELFETYTLEVIATRAETDEQRQIMMDDLEDRRNGPLRTNAGILDVSYPSLLVFYPALFVTWNSSSNAAVEAATASSSASYGATAGGFSGTGSSSSF
ncbi:DUF5129 domain-containing protein [Zhihengliuella flava]|uniref:DUF5129 domain-containing protein n=1 Tax=Zhihengliuella flava TaxID=1285193 RepID=A0A931GEC4_9MICC|nr:DUF5129 domain-containing protein [Zhihengliuella flava]MBG6084288.1 hypothetical protein [Zhihengliuella flava]